MKKFFKFITKLLYCTFCRIRCNIRHALNRCKPFKQCKDGCRHCHDWDTPLELFDEFWRKNS